LSRILRRILVTVDCIQDKGLGDKYVFFTMNLPNYNYVFFYFQIALLLCDLISQRLKADGIMEQFVAKVNGKVR